MTYSLKAPVTDRDSSSQPETKKSIAEILLPLQEAVSQSGHSE